MLKADFHIHSSEDSIVRGRSSAKEIIDIYSSYSYNVISITNKDRVFFSKELKKYAKSKGILLIPGIETKIYGKEILIINAPLHTPSDITLDQLKKLSKENTLIIAPHPYFIRSDCLKNDIYKYLDYIDAIEYSHFYHPLLNMNRKSVKIAKKYGKPLVANSDYTYFSVQLNRNYIFLDSKRDINSIFKAVKSKKFKIVTKPLKLNDFVNIGLRVVNKEIKKLKFFSV